MLNNTKKSLSLILYERTASPFYGTLIISWVLWNWKIFYLTFFISESQIKIDKISYIIKNFSDFHHLVTFPLLSTLIILTIIPFISNSAFWLNLKFEKWKKDKKNQIEKNQLMTLKQSLEIREQLQYQENRFEKLLEDKNKQIKQLNTIIETLETTSSKATDRIPRIKNKEFEEISKKIKSIDKDLILFQKILELMQGGYSIAGREGISSKLVTILEINDFIKQKTPGIYTITEKGKELTKKLMK